VETLAHTWKIVNRGQEVATLWLHQPKRAGYRLTKPEKPLKEVDNHYRFEVPLKAGETVDFAVEEKRDVQETVQMANSSEEKIRFYMAQPYLSAGAKAFMKSLSDLMARKAALQRQITEWNEQVKRLTEEQGRLRSNLQTLGTHQPKEQELRAKWVGALAANEDQLAERRAKLDDAGGKLRELEQTLAKKVRDYKDE
jgi:chromosome segregation ATPase